MKEQNILTNVLTCTNHSIHILQTWRTIQNFFIDSTIQSFFIDSTEIFWKQQIQTKSKVPINNAKQLQRYLKEVYRN